MGEAMSYNTNRDADLMGIPCENEAAAESMRRAYANGFLRGMYVIFLTSNPGLAEHLNSIYGLERPQP